MSRPFPVTIQIMVAYRILSANVSRKAFLFFVIDATMTYPYKGSSLNFTSNIRQI